MKRRSRLVIASVLVLVTVALVLGIYSLHSWGGGMEAMLMVFGDRVWVTLDARSPRVWFLMLIPGVSFATALSLYARRSGE